MAQLEFSPEFFKKEIRDGFPIGELMKRNWAAELQVLEDMREICEKNNLRWFAFAGTELGAVRHKGYIPWDDDIDTVMLGDDFVKFLQIAGREIEDYIVLSPYVRDEWDLRTITRIANGDRLNFKDDFLDRWHNCPLASGTDIFPLYYIPRDKEKEDFICDLLLRVEAIFQLNDYNLKLIEEHKESESQEISGVLAEALIDMQKTTGFEFTSDRTLANQLCMLYDQICRLTDEDEADYVSRFHSFPKYRDWKIRKDVFDKTIWLPFENIMVQLKEWVHKNGGDTSLTFEIPKEQKLSDSKNKKVKVLYYTSVREMIIYSEYVIDKIKNVIDYFKKNGDTLELCWVPGAFIPPDGDIPDFQRLVPELIGQYEALIERYKESDAGICDETGELNRLVDECDMYYGDEGFLSELFGKTGKPVYIQDYHVLWDCEGGIINAG